MSKILAAEGILADARSCVECIFLAASGLEGGLKHDATDPIQVVADIASGKINAAIALLDEYRESVDAPAPAAPDAKPKSPAARTRRKSK
jgi:hypothetical protein